MKSKYKSGKSVAKNQTVPIGVDDPRLAWNKVGQTKARQGAEIDIVGLDGKSLIQGGISLAGSSSGTDKEVKPKVTTPGVPKQGTPPLAVTDLVGDWGTDSDILLTFSFDTSDEANAYIDRFLVKVYDSLSEEWYNLKAGYGYLAKTFLDYNSSSQELTLSAKDLSSILNINTLISNITKVAVATADIINIGQYVESIMPGFVSSLPQPEFTLSAGIDYYLVTLDPENIALAVANGFYGVIVEEKVTTEMVKANVSLIEGWAQAAPISSGTSVVVYTPDGLHRWVRLKYVKDYGDPSIYSDILDITPLPFMPGNTTPPTQFTAASIAWSGNDISVSFTQPLANSGTTVKIKLVPYVSGVESTSLYAHFYHVIVPPETSFKINAIDLYGQFSAYYSKFKGYITSVSAQGVESIDAIISAGPIERTNSLANIYPTLGTPNVNIPTGVFRVTSSVSGYIVDFDMPSGATRLEVYEKSTAWTVIPTNDDNVVYSGLSPASIPTPDNNARYVIVRYYDQYDNYSHYSMEVSGQTSGVAVTPVDVGLNSLIEFPIKISTDGSIFSGAGDETVYPQVFFNRDGLFAYDADGDWTTEIINSATSGAPTFTTKRAVIGNWTVSPDGLQNTLYASGVVKDYTGMSANQTYAFWAGGESSLNSDGLAKFSVKPTGEVVASKITINGDGTGGDLIRAGGSNFIITQAGALTAQSAIIKGTIEVDGQSYFDANVNIRSGYLIAGSNGPTVGPNMQISSAGLKAIDINELATTKIYTSPQSITIVDALTGDDDVVTGITMWSKKALFGSDESSGFVVSDGVIKANYISIDSGNQAIVIRSQTANSTAGIVLQSSLDADYAIAVGNIPHPESAVFSVTTDGDLKATSATIQGTVKATGGWFGTDGGTQWEIDSTGITASGSAVIDLSSGGYISVGDYQIKSTGPSGTDFTIVQASNGLNLMKTESVPGATSDPLRLFLGDSTRQVEVAKSAQISGDGTTLQYGVNEADNNAYRSGGLRNMYTVASGNAGSAIYPSAVKGDVLLVYSASQGL